MAIPDYQSLMLPVLKIAAAAEATVPTTADQIADQIGLTAEERDALLPSGKQRLLHNRIHWAKFYLSKAGLVDSPKRGRFVATAAGKELLATNPEAIGNSTLMKYPAFVEFMQGSITKSGEAPQETATPQKPSDATPEEQMEAAYGAFSAALKSDLIKRILENSPAFFERLIVDLLVAMGYGGSYRAAAQQLGKSGDGGVDGVVNQDRLGLDRVYVQAKRYASGTVGRPEVQGFVGSLVGLGASKGVFVTTSAFSAQARDFVRSLSQRIVLIDGPLLADLMAEHNIGVRLERRFEIQRIDEDYFIEEE